MRRIILSLTAAAVAGLLATSANAALKPGANAPDFTAQASLGGKEFTHEFADAIDQYKALGATVIGVSHDKIEKLDQFSTSECRSKFAVAADPDETVIKAYDAVYDKRPEYANRVSYVIAPDGKVIYAYAAMDPTKHVENTLAAVKAWRDKHH
jgi:peroxiredoxin Q/BCP